MKPQINMIGIITSKFDEMLTFYTEVMGFSVKLKMDHFVEFDHEGVRFALSTTDVMAEATKLPSYKEEKKGHPLELAFKVDTPADVDTTYQELIAKGAAQIKDPADMPWQQRTAFFADPDGNVHEIFADLT